MALTKTDIEWRNSPSGKAWLRDFNARKKESEEREKARQKWLDSLSEEEVKKLIVDGISKLSKDQKNYKWSVYGS